MAPDTEVLELRSLLAGSVAPTVGMRPFAFALPSEAERYSVINPPSVIAKFASPSFTPRPSPYNTTTTSTDTTSSSTPKASYYPGGQQTDYMNDSSLDAHMDTKSDSQSDDNYDY